LHTKPRGSKYTERESEKTERGASFEELFDERKERTGGKYGMRGSSAYIPTTTDAKKKRRTLGVQRKTSHPGKNVGDKKKKKGKGERNLAHAPAKNEKNDAIWKEELNTSIYRF